MGFFWLCPCGSKNFYKGDKTKDANSTCSSCKKTQKIWSKRVIEVPTKSNQIQPRKLEIPTINHRTNSPLETVPIDTLETILQCMDRGISTIKNKPEIKKKVGAYYWDYVKWTRVWNALKLSYDVRKEEKR